jgi:hypothetical protein
MNGLTTIAALPTAGGCKAALSAEKAVANVKPKAINVIVYNVDLAGAPDSFALGLMSDCLDAIRTNVFQYRTNRHQLL